MAYQRVGTYYGNPWLNQIAAAPSGHFALFYPGAQNVAEGDRNQLVLYDAAGNEVARQFGALGGFDLTVFPSGEIVAVVTRWGENGVPADKWHTGVFVAAPPPPPPPPPPPLVPGGNAIKLEAVKELLAQAQAILATIQGG